MTEAIVAGRKPCLVTFVRAGDSILWCACGRSARQPYCDGSHKGTGISPVRVSATRDNEEALLCACKRTKSPPYCDGSHNAIGDYGAESETEFDWTSAVTAMRSDTTHGRADLDGGCFVLTPSPEDGALTSGWRVVPTIGPEDGADRLSQYLLKPDKSQTGSLGFGGAEVVLFVAAGEAEIDISERAFAAPLHSAVSIRPGEAFLARTKSPSQTTIIATVCPPAPMTADARGRFDEAFPDRTTPATIVERHSMGDRNYQVLTSELTGASEITQFIGGIPRSRAAVHRHLYEEALYILSGEGMMWTETRKAAVRSGDVIYLPRKQLHSLECTTPDGMVLAGSFFPAGSPAINY